jgi:hypothetical protein
MTPDEAAVAVVQRLTQAGVAHLLVGAFSSNHHGIPRSTKDVDIVIQREGSALADMSSVAFHGEMRWRVNAPYLNRGGESLHLMISRTSRYPCSVRRKVPRPRQAKLSSKSKVATPLSPIVP